MKLDVMKKLKQKKEKSRGDTESTWYLVRRANQPKDVNIGDKLSLE